MASGKSRRPEMMVGLFFLLTIGLLLLVVIFFAGRRNLFADRFQVKAVFSYVGGLEAGAPVRLAGLNIGTVSAVGITSEGKVEVVMTLQERYHERIRANSVARIVTAGLLGDKVLSLTVGSGDQPVVEGGGVVKSEDPLELVGVVQELRPALKNLEIILSSVAEITSGLGMGKGKIASLLDNMDVITSQVSAGHGVLGRLISDKELSDDFSRLIKNARVTMDNAEETTRNLALFSRDLPSAGEDVKAAVANLKASTAEISSLVATGRSVMDNFNEGSESFKETFDRFSEIGRRGELSMDRVDEVLTNIQESTRDVKEALEGLPDVMERVRGSMDDVAVILGNFKDGSASFKEAMGALPDMVDRGNSAVGRAEEVLSDITEASAEFPEIARSGKNVINSAEELLSDIKRSRVVRGLLAGEEEERSDLVIYDRRDTGYPR